jgi:hypothetical protein
MSIVVEQRTYLLKAEHMPAVYLEAYERLGLPAQREILGPNSLLGYYVTEIGQQNEFTHLWAYQDLEDRRRRRAALRADPRWQECLQVIRPMLEHLTNKIMYPAPFSPLQELPGS